MKNIPVIAAIFAAILMSCATPNPAMQTDIGAGVNYAADKAACEASGKDYRCESPMADCECVERPTPPPPPPAPPIVAQPTSPPPPPVTVLTSFSCAANEWREMETSGKEDWRTGKVTFSITGLEFAMLPAGKDYFLFMARMVTPNGKEGNFQFNIADLTPRLISQRFDGTCPRHCERQDIGDVNWLPGETYSFIFEWDTENVTCVVTDSKGNKVYEGAVFTYGPYAGADWIRIGNGVLPQYPAVSSTITVIAPKLE